MKRRILFLTLLGIMPSLCLGYSPKYNRLVQEKQRKVAELEKCTGSTEKLKIAGISTLGLTAVGVAGNIVEAKKIDDYTKDSQKLDKKIADANKDKGDYETKLADKEKADKESKECMESDAFKNKKLIARMKKEGEQCVVTDCVKYAKVNSTKDDCECKDDYGQPEGEAKCVSKRCEQLCDKGNEDKIMVCEEGNTVNVFKCESDIWKILSSVNSCNSNYSAGSNKETSDKTFYASGVKIFADTVEAISDQSGCWFVEKPCKACSIDETWDSANSKCKSSGS